MCLNGSAAPLTWSLRTGCTSKFTLSSNIVMCEILHSLSCLPLSNPLFPDLHNLVYTRGGQEAELRGVAGDEGLTTSTIALHMILFHILFSTTPPLPRSRSNRGNTHICKNETDTRKDGSTFSSSTHSGSGFPCGSFIKATQRSPLL